MRVKSAILLDSWFETSNEYLPPLAFIATLKGKNMSPSLCRVLSNICFVAGFVSVIASIAIWFLSKEPDLAHGERFGIFVGLWAPTFFALSSRLDQYIAPKDRAI